MHGLKLFGLAAVGLVSSISAHATTYNFVQAGYPDGAVVTGSFTGSDLNHDGMISSFEGELTSFLFNYSGSEFVAPFSYTEQDFTNLPGVPDAPVGGLVYDLDGTFDYPNGGVQVGNGYSDAYVALAGALQDPDFCMANPGCGFVGGDESGGVITVTSTASAAPEPVTWALLVSGFALVGVTMRRSTEMRVSTRQRRDRLPES